MIVVCGGSSFIGVYLVQALLDKGYEVLATGRNPRFADHYATLGVRYIPYDLSSSDPFETFPANGVESVVLLAALLPANSPYDLQDDENAKAYIEVNTLGTARLLEYCRRTGVNRLVSTTSYADVQMYWSKICPLTEDTPRGFCLQGDHAAYVISKNAATDLMLYYNEQYCMKNAVFRLPPVYGVSPHNTLLVNGERRQSGIARFIEQAKVGDEIVVYGDGKIIRDVVYVKDVADAFVGIIASPDAKGLYNIGSGESVSLYDQACVIAEVFQGAAGASVVRCDVSRKNDMRSYRMSIEKACNDFGYSPRFACFVDMMRDWYETECEGRYTSLFGA